MKDLILGLAIAGIVAFGFYLMKRLDRFLKHKYKSRRIEPDLNENGIMVFGRSDTSSKREQEKGKAKEAQKEKVRGEPEEKAPGEYRHTQK